MSRDLSGPRTRERSGPLGCVRLGEINWSVPPMVIPGGGVERILGVWNWTRRWAFLKKKKKKISNQDSNKANILLFVSKKNVFLTYSWIIYSSCYFNSSDNIERIFRLWVSIPSPCWCPGSWSHQSISRHGFVCVGLTACNDVPELTSLRISVLYFIIITKSEKWLISHYIRLGHKTMACTVSLSIFSWFISSKILAIYTP